MNLNILYEDAHVIVCYKPAGVPTQTARLGEQDMVSLLKNYLKGGYVAVVHRLDQPVEGVLVFAKTPFAAKELNKSMQMDNFGKYYKAVLWGIPKESKAILEDYLVKNGLTNTSRVCAPSEKDAKKAVLSYEVTAIGKDGEKDISLIKVKLKTGRHHQIRVQMANIGCPIWGDSKYNTAMIQDRRFRQIALCAYKLEFIHPKTKKMMTFEIEPQGEGFQKF
ncbi:MAG: RluA family pseudouridine synthase [Tyzzerella sp.]|nr:RluA family pseudouridine synthase [Tyzzerella sp.]